MKSSSPAKHTTAMAMAMKSMGGLCATRRAVRVKIGRRGVQML